MTVDRDKVLATLREKREHIEHAYGLRLLGIIGSLARGEATDASDIDVFADVVRMPTLFKIAGAENELADSIGVGVRVDLVLRDDLRPAMRATMERDFIPL